MPITATVPAVRRGADACLRLRCPACGTAVGLLFETPRCGRCGFVLETKDGILHALPVDRVRHFSRFVGEYSTIRHAEGRGSGDPRCYLALPFSDLTGRNVDQWAMRGRTYRYFERHLLPTWEHGDTLRILDLGAGTGWLSYRLALRGHRPVAVDIFADARDGLGASHHYEAALGGPLRLVRAEYDNLPFEDGQFDLAIFNASLHYSADYVETLAEAKRCLKPDGRVVVLDSPIYRKHAHGERMKEERHRFYEAKYGFRSDSLRSLEFLWGTQLVELAVRLGLSWRVYRPWYGFSWHLRPWKARLQRKRPPSRFHILVGSWEA